MGANSIDLTNVAAVNAILNQSSSTDSDILQTEITAYSQNILTRTGRSFLSGVRTYSERYNGNGSLEQALRNYPILSVAALTVNGIAIPASPDFLQSGYVIDTEGSQAFIAIVSNGGGFEDGWPDERWGVRPGGWGGNGNAPPLGYAPYRFARGIQNVAVTYTAGYTVEAPAEIQTVPVSPGPYTVKVNNAATFWRDEGVTLANGTPLTSVAGAPGAMQYVAPQWNVAPLGVYTLNSAQANIALNFSYAYGAPPFDLQEAAGRLVAEMYRKRQWIGQSSQMQPGVGTTSYSKLEVELGTAMTIERYKMRMMP